MSAFEVIVLGCTGGPRETNLSGYLLRIGSTDKFIVLDAGTLLSAIERASAHFKDFDLEDDLYEPSAAFFRNHIKAYLISHAHMDHLLGLVINSQDDTPKKILGLKHTIDTLRDHIFNYKVWPNFGNEGDHPLNVYHYQRLTVGKKEYVEEAKCSIEAFELNHSQNCSSTAFLIERQGEYLLYFGDTASDLECDKKLMNKVWERVAPLIREKKMHALFLECSYANSFDGPASHVHLNAEKMLYELDQLAQLAKVPLAGLKVIVTHNKESLKKGHDTRKRIQKELHEANVHNIDFIFPKQGDKIVLDK